MGRRERPGQLAREPIKLTTTERDGRMLRVEARTLLGQLVPDRRDRYVRDEHVGDFSHEVGERLALSAPVSGAQGSTDEGRGGVRDAVGWIAASQQVVDLDVPSVAARHLGPAGWLTFLISLKNLLKRTLPTLASRLTQPAPRTRTTSTSLDTWRVCRSRRRRNSWLGSVSWGRNVPSPTPAGVTHARTVRRMTKSPDCRCRTAGSPVPILWQSRPGDSNLRRPDSSGTVPTVSASAACVAEAASQQWRQPMLAIQ